MSRCFPFPPPGYDKKPVPEDSNVLKEERQKEKKHKKEKKDKEKRDKERSEGKQKDKKDKKDKHKDKRDRHKEKKEKKEKEKDRGKEKEKTGTSEVRKAAALADGKSGEKLGTEEGRDNNNYLDENNCSPKFHCQSGEGAVRSNFIARENEESKYVQELGRRIRDHEKVTSNQPERLSGGEKRRDDERGRLSVRNPGNSGQEKGKSKNREFDIGKVDELGYGEETRFIGPSLVQNFCEADKTKVSGLPTLVEKIERRPEKKEKTKEKREKRGENFKDKDTDKKDHGKDKDRGKEKKKKEKTKEKSEQKKSKTGKLEVLNRSNNTSATVEEVCNHSSEHNNKANAEGNLKKRKDLDINGFLHDNEIRPSKLQRPASHPVMENGRKLEASQTPSVFSSGLPGVAANLKADNKEHRKNGIVEPRSLSLSKERDMPILKPFSATVASDEVLEASKKHPHPDSKYLDQILSVPDMDEWSDVVDNDWLSGGKELPSRKPVEGSFGVGKEPQVWSEALYLEPVDTVALPYVLPY